jgi:hypothetical protein
MLSGWLPESSGMRQQSVSAAGTTEIWAVSLMRMTLTQRCCHLLVLIGELSLANVSGSVGACTSDGPLLTGKDGKPIWLDPKALVKSARHCIAPQMPALHAKPDRRIRNRRHSG